MAETADNLIKVSDTIAMVIELLYSFGSRFPLVRKSTARLSREFDIYAKYLHALARQLRIAEPVDSKETDELALDIYKQSYDLCGVIHDLIPYYKGYAEDMKLAQKVSWNFREEEVERLVREIRNLKRTTAPLASYLKMVREEEIQRTVTEIKDRNGTTSPLASFLSEGDTESQQLSSSTPTNSVADRMFVHYTISEDHTGTTESLISSRLAALGAHSERRFFGRGFGGL